MNKIGRWFQKNKVSLIFLLFLVFLAYANTLTNTFISDDVAAIPQNPAIGNFNSVLRQSFAFIQPLIYFFLFKLGGTNPFLYHFVNLLFHAGAVLVLYVLLSKMINQRVGFLAAGVFAVHPITTEAVTWISGGNYVRYSFFFLLSFLLYLYARQNKKLVFLSLGAFSLSLLSSEKAISLPVVFFLYEFLQVKKERDIKRTLPFFILAGLLVIFYALRLQNRLTDLGQIHYAQQAAIYNYNPLLQIPAAITSYLQLIFFPWHLTLYHSEVMSYIEVGLRSAFLLGFLALVIYSFKKNRTLFFWLSFFLISLLPTALPLGIASSIAERYVYLGSIGIIVTVVYIIDRLCQNKKNGVAMVVFATLITVLTVRTIIRNFDWKTYDSFWLSTVKTSPNSYQAHNNVGIIYARRGDMNGAINEFKKTLSIVPNSVEAYYNLAGIYFTTHKFNEALRYYEKTIALNPNALVAYQNMGAIYFEEKQYQKAEELTKKGLAQSPNNVNMLMNLGIIYIRTGEKKKAHDIFATVLRIDPENKQAHSGLDQTVR